MSNKYNYNDFPISKFFFKIIVVILIGLILAWVYNIFRNTNLEKKNKSNGIETSEFAFSKTLIEIKKKALNYYDESKVINMSKNQEKISVNKLFSKNEFHKLNVKNNLTCSLDKSYVILTKKDSEYQMKIYLICGEQSDYLNLRLTTEGNCDTYLCSANEKENDADTDKPNTEIVMELDDDNNVVIKEIDNKTKNVTKYKKNTYKKSIPDGIEIIDTTNDLYIYEYVKINSFNYSNWSTWTDLGEISCNSKINTCNQRSICLTEEKIDKVFNNKTIKYAMNQIIMQKEDMINEKVCANTNYISFNGTLYQTVNDYSNLNNWQYQGQVTSTNSLKDDLTTKYIYNRINYNNGYVSYTFDKYIYPNISIANLNCQTISKQIDRYSYQSKEITNYKEVAAGFSCHRYMRNRNLIGNSIIYVWSNYNNNYLLSNGYVYTGKKELKR